MNLFELDIANLLPILLFIQCTNGQETTPATTTNDELVIKTKYGNVQGIKSVTEKGSEAKVFFGIPYAKPPIGDLNFEYPQEIEPWTETHNATYLRNICMQFEGDPSEDCLYLNVYMPNEKTPTNKYPVLVWIHGGSFQWGASNDFDVDGLIDNLVTKGLVVVFINYRLGFWEPYCNLTTVNVNNQGFATTLNNNLPGNIGLEDQLMALKWVNENIVHFNGNPNAVTICGESAGAASVSLLGVSPKVKPKDYFQKLIMRSGSALAHWAMRSTSTKQYTMQVLQDLGCNDDANVKECLRKTNLDTLKERVENVTNENLMQYYIYKEYSDEPVLGAGFFSPVKDDYRGVESILPKGGRELMMDNAHLPIMTGTTISEFVETSLITVAVFNETEWHDMTFHIPRSHYDNLDNVKTKIEQFYGFKATMNTAEITSLMTKLISDHAMIYPSIAESKIYAEKSLTVYAYVFDRINDRLFETYNFRGANDTTAGAGHGFDLIYLFQSKSVVPSAPRYVNLTLEWDLVDVTTINFLAQSIYNFIATGNPSVEGFQWPKYSWGTDSNAANINGIGAGAELVNYGSDKAKFWEKLNEENHKNVDF